MKISKVFAALMSLTLVLSSPVYVEASWDLTGTNNYTKTYQTSGTFTVPYGANYEITLAGAAGGTAGQASAQYGEVVTGSIDLKAGDVVEYNVGQKGSVVTNGNAMVVTAGKPTTLVVNGQTVMIARAGSGAASGTLNQEVSKVTIESAEGYVAESAVHWCTLGNGTVCSESTISSYSAPGGCFTKGSHVHDGSCTMVDTTIHECDANCRYVTQTRYYEDGCATCYGSNYTGNEPCRGHATSVKQHSTNKRKEYACNQDLNTWSKNCKKNHTQMLSTIKHVDHFQGTVPGDGYMTLQLKAKYSIYLNGRPVKYPYFNNKLCKVIVYNGEVLHYAP